MLREPQAGDVVTYVTFMGRSRTMRVDGHGTEAGQPVLDGTVVMGPERGRHVWCYLDQIVTPGAEANSTPELTDSGSAHDRADGTPGRDVR